VALPVNRSKALGLVVLGAALVVALLVRNWGSSPTTNRRAAAAIAAARAEAERHGMKRARVIGVEFANHAWAIELQSRPAVYGGHATVVVAEDGAIITYKPGL